MVQAVNYTKQSNKSRNVPAHDTRVQYNPNRYLYTYM